MFPSKSKTYKTGWLTKVETNVSKRLAEWKRNVFHDHQVWPAIGHILELFLFMTHRQKIKRSDPKLFKNARMQWNKVNTVNYGKKVPWGSASPEIWYHLSLPIFCFVDNHSASFPLVANVLKMPFSKFQTSPWEYFLSVKRQGCLYKFKSAMNLVITL